MIPRGSLLAVATLTLATAAVAAGGSHAVVTPKGELKWADAGIPGVTIAAVEGDMASGPSHFYLRYPAGFVSPLHHHSADHYVTTISGQLTLIVEGKENLLPPGSYFAQTGKAPHIARCEGKDDCVMFIDARAAWDVVPEPPAK